MLDWSQLFWIHSIHLNLITFFISVCRSIELNDQPFIVPHFWALGINYFNKIDLLIKILKPKHYYRHSVFLITIINGRSYKNIKILFKLQAAELNRTDSSSYCLVLIRLTSKIKINELFFFWELPYIIASRYAHVYHVGLK